MFIGLLNLEPYIFNTAIMQLSHFHKSQGDNVELFIEFNKNLYDIIYCSSIFSFTDKSIVPVNAIKGGSGFDLNIKLPAAIALSDYDYSIFPNCKSSYIWFSRGCVNNCPFCIVPQKEGYIHPVDPGNVNPKSNIIHIMDNNFFANQYWKDSISFLDHYNLPITFDSGIDVKLFVEDHAPFILKYVKRKRCSIHIAWDNPRDNILSNLSYITKFIPSYLLSCYVLIGYWSTPEEDIYRVRKLKEFGITPYSMPYNKKDRYQMDFCRWVNSPVINNSCSWNEYWSRK